VNSRKTFVVDAHRGELIPRYILRADTLIGAFMELRRELWVG